MSQRASTIGFLWRSGLVILMMTTANPVLAASCLSNGCHQSITEVQHLHGPLAAELAGGQGCTICHQPFGVACSSHKAGKFSLKKNETCQICHGETAGTGSKHTIAKTDCLKCHNPHGSNTNQFMLRKDS